MAGANRRTAFAPAIDMALDDEVRRMQVRRLDALQRDRIAGRQVDHGIARAVVADQALQRSPIRKAVVLDVDQIVLGRRAADGCCCLDRNPESDPGPSPRRTGRRRCSVRPTSRHCRPCRSREGLLPPVIEPGAAG